MANNSKTTENIGLNAENFGEQIAELKEQNEKLTKENANLKDRIIKLTEENAELKKRPAVEAAELDDSSSQKQMKLSSETSDDMDATKMDTIGEKIITKPKSMLNPNCLYDTLAWIKRREMAKSALSTSSRRFQKLCWPKLHGNVKPHIVYPLQFDPVQDESGNLTTELTFQDEELPIEIATVPIASVPPPNYIIGFRGICINTLNDQILKFIECVCPILNGFNLGFYYHKSEYICTSTNTNEKIGQRDRLLGMLAMKAFSMYINDFHNFVHFQPNANVIVENVHEIRTDLNEKNMDLLFNWVNKSRADHEPKILRFSNYSFPMASKFVSRIKEEFSHATDSTNFMIGFFGEPIPHFVMENEQTQEVLSFYSGPRHKMLNKILIRFPKGKEHLKKEWEKIE